MTLPEPERCSRCHRPLAILQGKGWSTQKFYPTEAEGEGKVLWVWMRELLQQARVTHVTELKGTPIEAEFEGEWLVSWRVLEEVLP